MGGSDEGRVDAEREDGAVVSVQSGGGDADQAAPVAAGAPEGEVPGEGSAGSVSVEFEPGVTVERDYRREAYLFTIRGLQPLRSWAQTLATVAGYAYAQKDQDLAFTANSLYDAQILIDMARKGVDPQVGPVRSGLDASQAEAVLVFPAMVLAELVGELEEALGLMLNTDPPVGAWARPSVRKVLSLLNTANP